jgi:muconolactone delta-isomerase
MEFLVEFETIVPEETPESEVKERYSAEAAASAQLAREGRFLRMWRPPMAPGERKALGLYRADSRAQLDGLLGGLPLHDWMKTNVTALEPHPADPAPPT